jgi:hypothetical protein
MLLLTGFSTLRELIIAFGQHINLLLHDNWVEKWRHHDY